MNTALRFSDQLHAVTFSACRGAACVSLSWLPFAPADLSSTLLNTRARDDHTLLFVSAVTAGAF